MPNRILREGILTSEVINRLSGGAELFYRRLLSVADDFGRYSAHPDLLRAAIFPLRLDTVTADKIKSWLDECVKAGAVEVYEVDGRSYLHIAKFENGQRLRAKHSKYPSPVGHKAGNGRSNDGHARAESDAESYSYSEPEAEALRAHALNGKSVPAMPRVSSTATCCDCTLKASGKFNGASYCPEHLASHQQIGR